MVDTLDDVEPPYRSGDSDRVKRDPKWPTVADATRRINVLIEGQTEGPAADMAARDLIVLMRELGRVTAEGNHLKYERQEIIDNALEEQAALEAENRRLRALLKETRSQIHGDCWIREDLQRRIDAALAAEPSSGEAEACWSKLPRDMYVVSVTQHDAVVYDATMCSVPMAIGPEVRYSRAAPSPPPTQGEEELREWAEKRADDAGRLAREVLSLRQRADEATEACATFLEDEAQREGDDHSAFTLRQAAAAIRARIKP